MNTKGDRLKHAMSLLRLNQSAVAGVLGIKQPGVSERLRNLRELTFTDALKLEEHYGIRPDWLLRGDGPIFKTSNLVEESIPAYASLQVDTSEGAISKRFIGVVSAYTNNNRLQEKEAAALLHLSVSHWSQIKRGGKSLTITMLALQGFRDFVKKALCIYRVKYGYKIGFSLVKCKQLHVFFSTFYCTKIQRIKAL